MVYYHTLNRVIQNYSSVACRGLAPESTTTRINQKKKKITQMIFFKTPKLTET
jgi:hypothetical protein